MNTDQSPKKAAACPGFARGCGGCPLLADPYPDQLAAKQARARALLAALGPVEPILPAPAPLRYRNKAIATFAPGRGGVLTCGIYAAGTHKVLPYTRCLLQMPVLDRTVAAVLKAARACRYAPFDEDRGTGLLRHLLVRCSSDERQVMAVVVTAAPVLPGSRNFAAAVRKNAPWLTTLVQNVNPRRTSAVLGRDSRTLFGPGQITDSLCGLEFSLSPRSFYQVNPAQTERLYRLALKAAALTGRETVVDAYCGTGTIGLCAAGQAKRVIGVELNADAVRDAAANARRNHIANARFVCADATPWMVQAAAEGLRPDVVFLDPPRAGSTPECLAAVAGMAPKRVVYVSCNAETLARDARLLARLGYRAARFWPVDMFPQTEHVETVVLLSQQKPDDVIEIDMDLGEMDITSSETKATYREIQQYVLKETGLMVSNLYIAQVKDKCGMDKRPNYNLPKSKDARQPQCPPEKEAAIMAALKHFNMI